MKNLKVFCTTLLSIVVLASLPFSALAQSDNPGRFEVAVEPADASVCFWLEEWRCENDLPLTIGTEYFVYASADGYTPLNVRVLLQRDGQLLQLTLQPTESAQLSQSKPNESDLPNEAPQIVHSTDAQAIAGQLQSFSASVIDETTVQQVTLHYRAGEDFWQQLQMIKTDLDDTYMTTVEVPPGQDRIEYYISAIDGTGNESRIGDANYVLVRKILQDDSPDAEIPSSIPSATEESVTSTAATGSRSNWLYIGLGLLAVGALLAGSDDNPPSSQFTLDLTPPTQNQ